MAKAWITDLWVKDAIIDGHKRPPTPAQLRSIKTLPEEHRTARYGRGHRWRVGWREAGDANPRTKSFARRTDAEAFAAELEDDIRTGRYIAPEHAERLYKDVAKAWLASKSRIKDSTVFRYTRDLERYVCPRWGHIRLRQITRQDIEAWVKELEKGTAVISDSAKRKAGPLSPSTIEGIVRVAFGSPLRYAVDEGWIATDPLARVELPRTENTDDMTVLSHLELEALAQAAGELGSAIDRALVLTLGYTGLRVNEALALQCTNVDLEKRRLRVSQTWTVDKDGKRVLGPPKSWERRSVPIPDFLVTELEPLNGDWLFPAARGGSIHAANWRSRIWSKATASAGIDGVTIHDLRHTAASLAIAAGADVKVIQQMLGHKDASITLNTYGHLWGDRLDEVADALSVQRRKALVTAA